MGKAGRLKSCRSGRLGRLLRNKKAGPQKIIFKALGLCSEVWGVILEKVVFFSRKIPLNLILQPIKNKILSQMFNLCRV